MVSFNFSMGLFMLCERTNFRYCRLADMIEANGCPALRAGPVYDIPFGILALLMAAFFIIFISTFKELPLLYRRQIPTRGVFVWKGHFLLLGIYIFLNSLSTTFVATDGTAQQAMLALRGGFWFSSMLLLYWITLVDCHLVPSNEIIDIIVVCLAAAIGFAFMGQVSSPTAGGIITMTILFPFGAIFFHFLAMWPICIKRQMYSALVLLTVMHGANIAHFYIELYLNAPLCAGTLGILTGATLAVLVMAVYRVAAQLFYLALKTHEIEDGLPLKKRSKDDPPSSDSDKPFPVEFKDYSYDYTYSDAREDEH
jgi:hypothetical protein